MRFFPPFRGEFVSQVCLNINRCGYFNIWTQLAADYSTLQVAVDVTE